MNETDIKNTNTSQMEELFKTGAHFGYSRSRRHPSMEKFVFGVKNNVEIIDLEQTLSFLNEACAFVRELGKGKKQLLFIGSKAEAKEAVKNAASSIDQPYVIERWIGGIITNFSEIKKRIARLDKLEEDEKKGELSVYTKKEQLLFDREKKKLLTFFGGIRNLTGAPDAVFVIDPKFQSIATLEANKRNIPVIALVNTDCNLSNITYPIPANDSSGKTIRCITEKIVSAYQEGASSEQ